MYETVKENSRYNKCEFRITSPMFRITFDIKKIGRHDGDGEH